MPKKPSGLTRRGDRWYYRRRVPDDLVQIVGKKNLFRTLGTSSLQEACRKQPFAAAEVQAELNNAREELRRRSSVQRSKGKRTGRPLSSLSDMEIWELVTQHLMHCMKQDRTDFERVDRSDEEFMDEFAATALDDAQGAFVEYRSGDLRAMDSVARKMLAHRIISIDTGADQFNQLRSLLLEAEVIRSERFCETLDVNWDRSSELVPGHTFAGIDYSMAVANAGDSVLPRTVKQGFRCFACMSQIFSVSAQ